MTTLIESYVPTEPQKAFHEAPQIYRYFQGGFGAGKTKTLCWEAIDLGLTDPGGRIALFRDTKPDLRDSVMQTFFEECPPELIYSYKRREEVVVLTTGTEILFRSFRQYASSARNQFESKIKSLNLSAFGIDEANEVPENHFLLLQGRLRLKNVRRRCGFMASNPPNEDHWLVKYFDSKETDRTQYFMVKASSRTNPHLPADFIPNMEKKYPASWVKKFIDGEVGFMQTGDPVYFGFKTGYHTKPLTFMKHRPMHRYWDFGWHRPACVWAQIDSDGRWKIYREIMGHNQYIQYFGQEVVRISNEDYPAADFVDYGDPAGAQQKDTAKSAIETLREHCGIQVIHRFTTIKAGIDIIQDKLTSVIDGEPAFQIDAEKCPILTAGFEGMYAKAKVSDGKGMGNDEPIKDGYYEHPQDALRYGAVNVFGGNSGRTSGDFKIKDPVWSGTPVDRFSSNGGTSGWRSLR